MALLTTDHWLTDHCLLSTIKHRHRLINAVGDPAFNHVATAVKCRLDFVELLLRETAEDVIFLGDAAGWVDADAQAGVVVASQNLPDIT